MRIDILTLFPDMFTSFLDGSLLGAARSAGLLDVRLTNIRDFAEGVHRQVDDRPFGGGPGMLLMPGPVVDCVESVQRSGPTPGHLVRAQRQQYASSGEKRWTFGRHQAVPQRDHAW